MSYQTHLKESTLIHEQIVVCFPPPNKIIMPLRIAKPGSMAQDLTDDHGIFHLIIKKNGDRERDGDSDMNVDLDGCLAHIVSRGSRRMHSATFS